MTDRERLQAILSRDAVAVSLLLQFWSRGGGDDELRRVIRNAHGFEPEILT